MQAGRNTLYLIGVLLCTVCTPLALLAFVLLHYPLLGVVGATGVFTGLTMLAVGAGTGSAKNEYCEWALESRKAFEKSLLEHMGLGDPQIVFYPASKCGGRPCALYMLRSLNPPDRIPGSVIVEVNGTLGIRVDPLVESEETPEERAGLSAGESSISALLCGRLGVASSVRAVEADERVIIEVIEEDKSAEQDVIRVTGALMAQAIGEPLVLEEAGRTGKGKLRITLRRAGSHVA